jgi:hypothetical protein
MPDPNESYASYLLRFRSVPRGNGCTWVASMQSTATGERRSFPSVGALLEFLRAEFGEGRPARDAGPRGRVQAPPALK